MGDSSDVDVELADNNEPVRPKGAQVSFGLDLSEEKEKELLDMLIEEIDACESSRQNRIKKWRKWRRQREAIPEQRAESHALDNASRIEPPLSQIYAQTAYAEVKGYYDTTGKYFWRVASTTDDSESHEDAKLLTKYYGLLSNSERDLNMAKIKRIVSDEQTFMGLIVVKVVWDTLEWNYKSDEDDDGIPESHTMTFHDGPSIIPISQEDTYYPPFWDDMQRMPWVAHRLHYPLHEFENLVNQGVYELPENERGAVPDPKTWLRDSPTESEEESENIRGFEGVKPKALDLFEVHCFYDVDDDGIWEDIIITFHKDSRTIVSKTFNSIAAREFEAFGYIPRSFMIESRGVGQICEPLQDEASGIHRLRNDGMKLATIKMLAMRRSVARENKNTIYQGKIWITDNPREDLQAIGLGEVPNSSLESENQVWSLAAQATGTSSPERGFSDPVLGTRDTFKGQQLRLQSAEGIKSTIIESTSESWSHVGLLIFFLLVRNAKRVMYNERELQRLSDDELTRLEKILSIKMSDVPRKFHFEIMTTDIEHSYEARRDTIMQLTEITFNFEQQLIMLSESLFGQAGAAEQQQFPEAWGQKLQVYVGAVNLLKEIYTFADFNDTENYLQDVSFYEKIVQKMRDMNKQRITQLNAIGNQGVSADGVGTGPQQPPASPVGPPVPMGQQGAEAPPAAGGLQPPGGNAAGSAGPQGGGAGPGIGGQ